MTSDELEAIRARSDERQGLDPIANNRQRAALAILMADKVPALLAYVDELRTELAVGDRTNGQLARELRASRENFNRSVESEIALNRDLNKQKSLVAEAAELLKMAEYDCQGLCPICGWPIVDGQVRHKDDCELAAWLEKVK